MSAHAPKTHNGGPPLVEEDEFGNIRMRYARIHISDFLNGIRKLPLDARGFYVTGLFCMYDNMGALPPDDRMAAMQMGCDLRTYRRFRTMMLDPKAFGDGRTRWIDTGEGLSQERVQNEITEYCREFKNRRDAALKREDEKRQKKATLADARNDVADTSTEDEGTLVPTQRPSCSPESSDLEAEMRGFEIAELSEKTNKNNDGDTTVVPERAPQSEHGQTRYTLSPKPKPIEGREEKRIDEKRARSNKSVLDDLERQLIEACNGALDNPANCMGLLNLSVPQMWLQQGCDLDLDVIPTLRAVGKKLHGTGRIRGWEYFTNMVAAAKTRREKGLPDVESGSSRGHRRQHRDGTYSPSISDLAGALSEIEKGG